MQDNILNYNNLFMLVFFVLLLSFQFVIDNKLYNLLCFLKKWSLFVKIVINIFCRERKESPVNELSTSLLTGGGFLVQLKQQTYLWTISDQINDGLDSRLIVAEEQRHETGLQQLVIFWYHTYK